MKTDVIVDTSFLVTLWFKDEPRYDEASAWYMREMERRFVTTPVALAEMDHLLRKYGGRAGQRIVAANVATGALEVDWWDDAVRACWEIVKTEPHMGLTDASLVALAAHRQSTSIATYDQRHFRAVRPLTGEEAFTLLPADAAD